VLSATAATAAAASPSSSSRRAAGAADTSAASDGLAVGSAIERAGVAKIGVTFSPGGLAFPYLLGAADALRRRGVITDETPLAGSSAGAIVAAVVALNIPPTLALEAAFRINAGCRKGGARGRLLDLLGHECKDLIPEDAAERLAKRPGLVQIAVCRLFHTTHLLPQGVLLSSFEDQRGIIEAILASSCIPFYAASTPCCSLGGWPAVDGYFAVDRQRFGCPPTGALRDIAVSPFNFDELAVGRIIPAGFYSRDDGKNDLICPGLFSPVELSTSELLTVALAQPPADDDVMARLFEQGTRDAEIWCRDDPGLAAAAAGAGLMAAAA